MKNNMFIVVGLPAILVILVVIGLALLMPTVPSTYSSYYIGRYRCINNHLYIMTSDSLVPMFDYRSNIPKLIQCQNKDGNLIFDKNAILESDNKE